MSKRITWLHLSDLHYSPTRTGWDASRVLSTLKKDLQKMQAEHGLCPNLLFFTGDVAYGQLGSDPTEIAKQFEGASNFLHEVRRSFDPEVAIENTFIVPGNHDVNRHRVTEEQILWLDQQRNPDTINALLHNNSLQWTRFAERLYEYRAFLKSNFSHLLTDTERLFYSIDREINGLKVRILGLNSAWSCCRDGEKGKLWMGGRYQIETGLQGLDSCDVTISLMHHPSNWLVEQEDPALVRQLERDVDFSLHGHEHSEWVTQTGSHVRIAAGACYEKSDKSNGYNLVTLDVNNGSGEIWLRRYHPAGSWIPEIVPDRTDHNGVWTLANLHLKGRDSLVLPIQFEPYTEADLNIRRSRSDGYPIRVHRADLRPVVDAWVGREPELESLRNLKNGIAAITGIGGQGKSFLVAKFLESWISNNPNGLWDWRDCKEEGERFFTQLMALIEHFTEGTIRGDQLAGADTRAAIRYFFHVFGDKTGVIVLDNVDHYVNQRDENFRLGVGVFVEEALRASRNLLIILTCRPHVSYGSARFLEIALRGVELDEALELFRLRGVKLIGNEEQIQEIWSRTEGHPLWLNLIATQMSRSPRTAPNIVEELRKGKVDDRTRSMFGALWKGLNDRQRTILRSMAEVHYPETFESIQSFVGSLAGTRNQLSRAFEGLKSLSLVVERGSGDQGIVFDLHPLVRSFVRTEYPNRHQRLPYIQQVLLFLARWVEAVEEPSKDAPLEDLQRWSAKAELEMETRKYVAALETISCASDQLVARGFHEEFFRVAKPLLDSLNWASIEMQDAGAFHDVVVDLTESLVEHKREDEARELLKRYERAADTTVARLRYLKLATYVEWMVGNYSLAIALGKEGVALKNQSQVDTTIASDATNTLALALRDNGQWDEALRIFAPNQPIAEIVTDDYKQSGKSAPFYGNVGRCLQFKGELEQALKCYAKSAALLDPAFGSSDVLNKGFATLWIGEALQQLGDADSAYCFYRLCVRIWSRRSPLRVSKASDRLLELSPSVDEKIRNLSDSDVEHYCHRWVQKELTN